VLADRKEQIAEVTETAGQKGTTKTSYSLTSHFAVAGSISIMLIWSPCFSTEP